MRRPGARREGQTGFTLLELLSVVAIALVLLSFALPGYREFRFEVQRGQALQALQQAAACQARHTALNRTAVPRACVPAPTASYRFLRVPLGRGSQAGHEWRAEPVGPQRGDACGTLALDHRGQKRALGAPWRNVQCWRGR